ncbi:hypothetical protein Poli38472_005096 [Pythium oligandrum]|uniref:Uncharacterized protein n=1 Tax=Pythium oligandrum TaxID=41045 RepID=A0A8K1CGA3_PYTOL|nr:hypothetical protein Poli38472_005096 [Pythium oligandrum]|eukprot:TMW62478.1 hypothetical protein Poli38472_005096 [Pythium oligandrum]
MDWDWGRYCREVGRSKEEVMHDLGGFGASASRAHAVLRACPALKELEMAVYHPGDGSDESEIFEFGYDLGPRPVKTAVPAHEMLNEEMYGDEFVETLARHCPDLERFTIWNVLGVSARAIMTFTDRAFEALATLRYLTYMEIKSVNITGNGLFTLLNNHPIAYSTQRCYVIGVGDTSGSTEMAFYGVVETLLATLAAHTGTLPCEDPRVVLRLQNANATGKVDKAWSSAYLTRIKKLVAVIKQNHPTVRLRVAGWRMTDTEFEQLFEFGFYTRVSEPSEWFGWHEDRQDTKLDDVFVTRGGNTRRPEPETYQDDEDDDY